MDSSPLQAFDLSGTDSLGSAMFGRQSTILGRMCAVDTITCLNKEIARLGAFFNI